MTDLDDIVRAAIEVADIESAAIFVASHESPAVTLAAAAGIEGPPLDGLVAAVQNPAHPIALAMDDSEPTFDVRPMNPGGPALRSHLPLGRRGVLAVAHNASLDAAARSSLAGLAATATARLGG
jgi:hypothetical protein